jgi:hypothetical protein
MTSPKTLGRIAGSLYLVVAVLGGFAELYVRSSIVVAGDAAGTADNIRGSATLFRVGFVSDLVQATFFLLTAMALSLLLRDVHELVARAMVVIVSVSVAIICLNLLNQYVALSVATGDEYRTVFGAAGSDALVGLFADMHASGYLIAQMFFGLWLLPLGYLVYRSGYFTRSWACCWRSGPSATSWICSCSSSLPASPRASSRSSSPRRRSGSYRWSCGCW